MWEKAKMPLKRLGRKGYSLGLKVPVVYLKGRENWFDRKLGRQTNPVSKSGNRLV